MVKVSLNAAAKLAGVSKSTISKALKTGALSYSDRTTAGYQIDVAELSRVYQIPSYNLLEPAPNQSLGPIANTSDLAHMNQILVGRLEAGEDRQRRTDAMLEDIREDRDRWRQQATALLSDQRPQPASEGGEYKGEAVSPAPSVPGFWSRLLGRV